jgi:hypothetical protein
MTRLTIDGLTDIVRRELARAPGLRPVPGAPDGSDAEIFEAHLDALDTFKDCTRRTARRSHRRVLGTAVRAAKKLYRILFRPFIHETLETQSVFNDHVHAAYADLVRVSEARDDALEHRCRVLEERVERLTEELRALRGETRP